MLPLSGVRVIEIGTVLMAPYAGQWLADMGADVIKVEPPGGDQTRITGPAAEPGMAAMFLALNRSKRSVVLDLATASGRDTLKRLVASADVVMHNIRQQKLVKLGLDSETLTARHPRLVYAALQGFSPAGPYGARPAYDDIIQGMSGTADLIRRQTGSLRYAPMALADKISGMVAAMAIAAALAGRERTGYGTVVEAPMFETMVAFNMVENFGGCHFGNECAAMGYGRTLAGERGPYRTGDGHVSFMPYTDRQWRTFFRHIGHEELADDPRFADLSARTDNIDALYGLLAETLLSRTSAEWLAFADAAEIPSAPVLSLEEILDDAHLAETGFFAETEDAAMGRLRYPGVPVRFGGERPPVRQPPRLDEHREEILSELDSLAAAAEKTPQKQRGRERMTLPFKLVSADSHIAEPPDLWRGRIEARFAHRAPTVVSQDEGDYFVIDQSRPPKEGHPGIGIGLLATKRKYTDPEGYDFGHDGRWHEVPESAYDPHKRAAELDREGIEAELIYPTLGLGIFGLRDRDYRYACISAYNQWLAEYTAAEPGRLFGVAVIATDDLARDIAELERCARSGLRGAMVAINQKSGAGYGDAEFDPLWAAAADLGMPISLHVSASETGFHATGNMWADFACVFTPTMYTIVSMIFSGVFDRHRGLKALSVENDASWALAVLERMDDRWQHDRHWAGGHALTSGRLPSEIFHDQVACTFMRDRTAILNREIIGQSNLMWGSDFPHFDGAWPNSAAALERQFDGIPPEDQIRIGRRNAIDFYKLPLDP